MNIILLFISHVGTSFQEEGKVPAWDEWHLLDLAEDLVSCVFVCIQYVLHLHFPLFT